MSGQLELRQEGAVAHVTIAHAGKFNAMSRSMWSQLKSTFEGLQQDTGVRCIIVKGLDGHFCAGGDISEYPGFRFDGNQLAHFHEVEVWGGLAAMLNCDVPIIAQVEGNCMGAGVEIASCCDIRMAATTARFGAPIARLGFPMAPRELALVTGAVGPTAARAMLLAAEVFDAAAMTQFGFLTHVVPPKELPQAVGAVCTRVATLAPQAARMNKQTIRALNGVVAPVNTARAAPETIANANAPTYAYAASSEHREGIAAFLEKRKPAF